MFLQAVTTAVTLFALYRLLLRTLGPEQMGIWALIAAIAMLGRLADLGLSGSAVKLIAREIARARHDSAAIFMETVIIFVTVASGALLLACYPIFAWSLSWLLRPPAEAIGRSALAILVVSTWLTIIATTICAGLDATQRYDLRGTVMIVNSVAQLVAAAILVPDAGLVGMAWALVIQWSITLGLGWFLVRRQLTISCLFPYRFSSRRVCELVRYGLRIQAGWMLVLLVDPVTKSLLSCFGALETVAYFDMASRLVLQFRQLTVSSVQILTAMMADLSETAPARIRAVYIDAFRLLLVASILGYAALGLCMPLIADVWIGRIEVEFVFFALIAIGASLVNSLSCPAFFANLGLGRVRENTTSLTVQVLSNALLGALLGFWLEGAGVVIGGALAMVLGSVTLIVTFGRRHAISTTDLFPSATIHLLLTVGFAVAVGCYLQHAYTAYFGIWLVCIASLAQFAVIALPTVWFHPVRRLVLSQSQSR